MNTFIGLIVGSGALTSPITLVNRQWVLFSPGMCGQGQDPSELSLGHQWYASGFSQLQLLLILTFCSTCYGSHPTHAILPSDHNALLPSDHHHPLMSPVIFSLPPSCSHVPLFSQTCWSVSTVWGTALVSSRTFLSGNIHATCWSVSTVWGTALVSSRTFLSGIHVCVTSGGSWFLLSSSSVSLPWAPHIPLPPSECTLCPYPSLTSPPYLSFPHLIPFTLHFCLHWPVASVG